MSLNNKIKSVGLPIELQFEKKSNTEFINNLESIKVTLMNSPSMEELREYLISFVLATWKDNPIEETKKLNIEEKDNIIKDVFFGKYLPTALETIGCTFLIQGISIQEATHILRHRMASFAAECSDKWWTNHRALVPNAIQNSKEFNERYEKIVKDAMELYVDMIDSKKISLLDARYIMPRCMETYYFMRMNLKDCIMFIKQRIDKQIQPETDNLIAYYMYIELLKKYPLLKGIIDIHSPSKFFIDGARTGKMTNLYFPDKDSDCFEYNENDFVYKCTRDKLNGTDEDAENLFNKILSKIDRIIDKI